MRIIAENSGRKLIQDLKIQNKKLGELCLSTAHELDCNGIPKENNFVTALYNSSGKKLGHEIFSLNSSLKEIFEFFLTVEDEYQKRFRIGEQLRLSSIIAMLENGIKKINLYSKDTAIYYHSKYKFKPDIVGFSDRDAVLKNIASDSHPLLKPEAQSAVELIRQIEENKNNPAFLRDACKSANKIVQAYINKVLESKLPQNEHKFNRGMNMVLEDSNIIENREFFNNIYQKHAIDYKI